MVTWIDASKEKPAYDPCMAVYTIVIGEYRYAYAQADNEGNFDWTVGPVFCDWMGNWEMVNIDNSNDNNYAIVVRRWAHFPEPPPFEK